MTAEYSTEQVSRAVPLSGSRVAQSQYLWLPLLAGVIALHLYPYTAAMTATAALIQTPLSSAALKHVAPLLTYSLQPHAAPLSPFLPCSSGLNRSTFVCFPLRTFSECLVPQPGQLYRPLMMMRCHSLAQPTQLHILQLQLAVSLLVVGPVAGRLSRSSSSRRCRRRRAGCPLPRPLPASPAAGRPPGRALQLTVDHHFMRSPARYFLKALGFHCRICFLHPMHLNIHLQAAGV